MHVPDGGGVAHLSLVGAGTPFPEVARAFASFAGREFTTEEVEIGTCYVIRARLLMWGECPDQVAAFCKAVALPMDRVSVRELALSFLEHDPLG